MTSPHRQPNLKPGLFFVLGAPKSGTTWLQKALDEHPEVRCKGEGKFHYFRDRLADAGVAYNRFLADRSARVFGEASFPPLKIDEVEAVFAAFVETRIRSGDLPPEVRCVGAKDPDFGLYIEEFAELFPDIPYIHIVRDPRDVALSMYHHMSRAHPEVNHMTFEQSLIDTARGWRHYVEAVRRQAARQKLDYIELTYETLTADTEATLRTIFARLDVSTSDATIARCIEATRFETLSRGRKPGQEDRGSFYRKGLPGGWRDEVSPELADDILRAAGPTARGLGYV